MNVIAFWLIFGLAVWSVLIWVFCGVTSYRLSRWYFKAKYRNLGGRAWTRWDAKSYGIMAILGPLDLWTTMIVMPPWKAMGDSE